MPSKLREPPVAEPGAPARRIAQVVVDARVGSSTGLFDYLVPPPLEGSVEVGQRVRVPFGKRMVSGFVYALTDAPAVVDPRPIDALIDAEPLLPPSVLRLAAFVSEHYVAPLDEVIRAIVPPRVRAVGVRPPKARRRRSRILTAAVGAAPVPPPALEPAQQAAVERIRIAMARQEAETFLLHGVTGSGKTEVYLAVLDAVIRLGGQGLVLVPEIALTPQAVARFAARFPGRLAVLHSSLTEAERAAEWWRIRRGEADIVIGPRSAVFAPLPRLRLIAIDEEEASAFKQDRMPRYHAPTVARELARDAHAVLVLGSATPSVVAYARALAGEDRLLELPHRAQGRALPPVEIVDMRAEIQAARYSPLSQPLQQALRGTLEAGGQSILFLNRRGLATFVLCRDCGSVRQCPHCSVALVHHGDLRQLQCHYCGTTEPVPVRCPACGSRYIKSFGIGTERVEQEVMTLLPGARVLRLDRDAVRGRDAADQIFEQMLHGEADILVGTQLVAKGLDLPGVMTVGVVNADTSLHFPDYRAAERTFSLLTQVAGRAGRGTRPAAVYLQTYTPDHPAVRHARYHDYRGFFREELELRRTFRFPPFRELIVATHAHRDEARAQSEARAYIAELTAMIQLRQLDDIEVLGPSNAFLYRLKDEFRVEVTIRGTRLDRIADRLPRARGWAVDVDPM
ncbi:MAG TPA: primosomal protein N' [Candidatus Limnocylindrales bacterium]|nr:primosomal protein N' [Candidatus Limnocylindrales bacterium]